MSTPRYYKCNIFSTVLSILLTILPDIHGFNYYGLNGTTYILSATTPVFKTIRLAKTYNVPTDGVVEVFVDGNWGAICDDNVPTTSVGIAFADVVCRELGYTTMEKNLTEEYPHRNRHYRYGSYGNNRNGDETRSHGYYRWFYDDLRCKGNEESLKDCYYSSQRDSCIDHTVAAVQCNVVPYKIVGNGNGEGGLVNILWLLLFILMVVGMCFLRRRMINRRMQQQQQQRAVTTTTQVTYTDTGTVILPSTATSYPPPSAGSYPAQPQANPYPSGAPPGAQYQPQSGPQYPSQQPGPQYPPPQAGFQYPAPVGGAPYPPPGGSPYPPPGGATYPPPGGAPYPPPGGAPYPPPGGASYPPPSNVPGQPNPQTTAYQAQPASNPAYPPPEGYQPANYAPDPSAPPPPSYESVN